MSALPELFTQRVGLPDGNHLDVAGSEFDPDEFEVSPGAELYRQACERLEKYAENWVTIRGTHVLLDGEGKVKSGPAGLKGKTLASAKTSNGARKSPASGTVKLGGSDKEVKKKGDRWFFRPVQKRFQEFGAAGWINASEETGKQIEAALDEQQRGREQATEPQKPPGPEHGVSAAGDHVNQLQNRISRLEQQLELLQGKTPPEEIENFPARIAMMSELHADPERFHGAMALKASRSSAIVQSPKRVVRSNSFIFVRPRFPRPSPGSRLPGLTAQRCGSRQRTRRVGRFCVLRSLRV